MVKINELERTKERLDRCEKMILQTMERLQAIEMDNVKNKAQIERTKNSLSTHINDITGHEV